MKIDPLDLLFEPVQSNETKHPNYHPAVVGWRETWKGKTWRDMPGHCDDVRKLNFALFRRGLYDPATAHYAASAAFGRHFPEHRAAQAKAAWGNDKAAAA